jgi:hypothetical protein
MVKYFYTVDQKFVDVKQNSLKTSLPLINKELKKTRSFFFAAGMSEDEIQKSSDYKYLLSLKDNVIRNRKK